MHGNPGTDPVADRHGGDIRDLDSERSRANLAPKPAPEPVYEIDSHIREAGASQRAKGWVYG